MTTKLKRGAYKWVDRGVYGRQTSNGMRYGISYVIPAQIAIDHGISRERREIVGSTITIARLRRAERITQVDAGDFSFLRDFQGQVPTLDEFWPDYLAHAKTTKKASWGTDVARSRPLLAFMGRHPMDRITPWTIDQYKISRDGQVGPRTINMELQLLRHMLNCARDWDIIDVDVAALFRKKFLHVPERPIRTLSDDEEARLLAAAVDHVADVCTLSLHMGLRMKEILAIEIPHCRFDERILAVLGKGGRTRDVPMNTTSERVLRRRVAGAKDGALFHWGGARIKRFYHAWYNALERAGIDDLDFHDLRRSFGCRLLAAGVDLVTIQKLYGHKSIQTTMLYLGVTSQSKMDAVRRLETRVNLAPSIAHGETRAKREGA